MSDLKSYFHPETIKRISRLELRSKYIVEGMLSGMHRSPFFGQSLEFRQHREYVPGDDLRHVDWKVWARQDRLYVKQFEEDTNLNCHILVDQSESMTYGGGRFTKHEFAATLACCISYLVVRQKDAVACSVFDDQISASVQLGSRTTQLEAIAGLFQQASAKPKTSLASVLSAFSVAVSSKSLVVLISDFFEDVDSTRKGIQMLRQRGHDVLLIHVMDADEIEFPFDGPVHFEGLETDDELKCNPAAFRESYCESVKQYLHDLTKACAATSCDYELCTTDMAFNTVLSKLLNRRISKQKS